MKKERVLKFEVCVNVSDKASREIGEAIAGKIADALYERGIAHKVMKPEVKTNEEKSKEE